MDNIGRDTAETLKAIIDTAIDGIITIDHRGHIERINQAALRLFGYTAEEVIGENVKMLMTDEHRSHHDGYIQRYRETRKPNIIGIGREVLGQRKDGSVFPFRLAVSEVILNDRVIFTGVIHDLSEVKEAQETIIKLNKQLEERIIERTNDLEEAVSKLLSTNKALQSEIQQKNSIAETLRQKEIDLQEALTQEKELGELKTRFVSMASHEFRTPLTSILSSAALISRYTEGDQQDRRDKHIDRIKSAVANLTGILSDFLSYSSLEEGRIEVSIDEFELQALIDEVSQDLVSVIKKNQSINAQCPKIKIFSDRRIVKNILFNLISNAIKYSEKDITCRVTEENAHITIEVIDQGIGISESDQKHLFTRFFRGSNAVNIGGTGLGLTIVQHYTHLIKGELSYTSQENVGSTFTIKIPK